MKAPNGAKSNLTERQWITVRTSNFKAWFGDWENDPDNASKVIDENGEPLVVYHRTERGNNFSIFKENSDGIHFGTRRQADDRAKGKLFPVFLNVRNPDRTYDQGASWYHYVKWTKDAGYDGIVYLNEFEGVEPGTAPQDSWIVFSPNQIKSATKNNGYFDSSNPDIYKQTANTNSLNNNAVHSVDDFLTPEARQQVETIRKQYQGTRQWLKAPNGQDTKLNELQWLLVRTPNFKRWFGDWENAPANASKVVDENGEPKVVYHGTGRADRVGSIFRKDRATSGPMAFFTDSREIAENYAKDKADTSLASEELGDYENQFVIVKKGRNGNERYIKLRDYVSSPS